MRITCNTHLINCLKTNGISYYLYVVIIISIYCSHYCKLLAVVATVIRRCSRVMIYLLQIDGGDPCNGSMLVLRLLAPPPVGGVTPGRWCDFRPVV